MTGLAPEILENWFSEKFELLADETIAAELRKDLPASAVTLGVSIDEIRSLAREANRVLAPEPQDWARYLSIVIPKHNREHILAGIMGLGRLAASLDDLFGERLGGWARELDSLEITDYLAAVTAWWVLDDMSRIGYLEAWTARGENIWKKRLAAMATIPLNEPPNSFPMETIQVVRHLMGEKHEMLREAVSLSMRKLTNEEAVERFLAWWAPRIEKSFLVQIINEFDEHLRERILALA